MDMRLTRYRPRVVETWFYLHLSTVYAKLILQRCHVMKELPKSGRTGRDCYIFKAHKSSIETLIVLLYLVVIPNKQLLKKDTHFSTNLTCDARLHISVTQ